MDGTDNPMTRYLINDVCVINKVPLVSGSALQWEGQITLLNYENGPCYRCLYPKPPPANCVTNCSDGGVLGMVPGLIGQLQAVEIVKLVLGQPKENLLWRRMIFVDTLSMKFRNVKLREQNPNCVACGSNCPDKERIKNVAEFDYLAFCGLNCANKYALIKLAPENNITPTEMFGEIKELPEDQTSHVIVDVRPEVQYGITNTTQCHEINQKIKTLNI